MLTSLWLCPKTICLHLEYYINKCFSTVHQYKDSPYLMLVLGSSLAVCCTCVHSCLLSLKRCWCRVGYKPVDDGLRCADVDECVERPDICSHHCNNTLGSFQCSCSHGYVLEPDGHSCKITGGVYVTIPNANVFFCCCKKTGSIWSMYTGQKHYDCIIQPFNVLECCYFT